ncbi:hypothetical protein NA78x_001612 [Anatilimnocola sp. NA78]|uniref:hypothetical protein n=1 Tax=Anatilimnocola sp. NA78 TaxID=3415683 RepID=UPI003CE48E2C
MGLLRSVWTAALWLGLGAGAVSPAMESSAIAQEIEPTNQVYLPEEAPGCGCDLGLDCCLPDWHVSANAIFLGRSTPGGGAIVATNPALVPISSSGDFDFGWNGGIDLALTRRLANGDSLQVRFFGIDSIATTALVSPSSFIGAGFTGPGGTAISGRYVTSLDNTEINWRRACSERLTWLAGFRWIELKDEMNYRIGPVARSEYEYNNHMYGGQLGLDYLVIDGSGPWQINAIGKAGIFANIADGGIAEFGPGPIGGFRTTETRAAFVGELGVTASYHVTEQFAFRMGYELLFLGNLGLASDNAAASISNPSLLAANVYTGDLFYHGVTAGIEYVW